jgi:hypothetical protein
MTEPEQFEGLETAGTQADVIPVHISYEIIRLFSEGLYQSPHKAIEELVSNGYDAGATSVHVIMPNSLEQAAVEDGEDGGDSEAQLIHGKVTSALWVIDNGSGMNAAEFVQLWRVAYSTKTDIIPTGTERAPIGQFGIGKLAAYVLAWRLLHISRSQGQFHLTSMDFRKLGNKHQDSTAEPFTLDLRKIDESVAKSILADVEERDPTAWAFMFGVSPSPSWTAAGLSDFKDLYDRLYGGRLSWVLRTGLPLHSNFSIWLNGDQLESSKIDRPDIATVAVGGSDDAVAKRMGLSTNADGVEIPGITGTITGAATLYRDRLTEGKSDQYSRSNGFFIRVRGRVINLEDELFGLDVLNHAAWSRFAMDVNADGLRDHLLSSREGVRESQPIETLRQYLHNVFNVCRQAFDDFTVRQVDSLDLDQLLRDAPSVYVTEPLVTAVSDVVRTGQESFYIDEPEFDEDTDQDAWLGNYQVEAALSPFKKVLFESLGKYDKVLRYLPDTQTLVINTDHPFIDKLLAGGKPKGHVTLFSSAEVFIDALMQEHGVPTSSVISILEDRDRILRLLAGDQPSTAAEVLRLLDVANTDSTALERVVGAAFRVLGFEYERRGGNTSGTDGVLYARLGKGSENLADYKVVYDSKQTDEPSVPADKVKIDSLEDFRRSESAQFGFFFANHFAAEDDVVQGKLNKELIAATSRTENPAMVTLLRIEDLKRIVKLHYRYGVTLTRMKSLFGHCHTVPEVTAWIDQLDEELKQVESRVPLQRLLEQLEVEKHDMKAIPNVNAARVRDPENLLQAFEPERLIAALKAVETIVGSRWIEVESTGGVRLHHTATQIIAEVERAIRDLFGVDASEPDSPPT